MEWWNDKGESPKIFFVTSELHSLFWNYKHIENMDDRCRLQIYGTGNR